MDSSPTHGPTQPTQNPGATLHPPHPGKLTSTTDTTVVGCLTNEVINVSRDFWNARGSWYPTWNPDVNNGEDAAMVVDYVRVYEN